MKGGKFTGEELESIAKEFRKRFGKSHTLSTVHDRDFSFFVASIIGGDSISTMLNIAQPHIARAMLMHRRGIAAQEHALMHDGLRLKSTPIKSMKMLEDMGIVNDMDGGTDRVTSQILTVVKYTSALTRNEHAGDFVRYDHAKYSYLHSANFPYSLRAPSLLCRAYIEVVAGRHDVDVDAARITRGMSLDDKDQEVMDVSREMLEDVQRQRAQGRRVDIRPYTTRLDSTFGLQPKMYSGS